ncbi:MAG: family 10 glycosylhydrolase, partial [Candidatus Marinimicrobia bacterium]|nr:family 10 glycosylhydrolase [Candidatus Neomarinimicrobiota bacterium]
MTRDYATSRDNIDKVLDFCVKHNIDDVYFQIRGRGDAFYKSRFIPMSPRVKEPDFDPLAYICEQAMPRKLKIHAWFNTYILYSNAAMKPEDTHIYTLFPEWTSTDKNGFNDASLSFNKMRNKNFEGSYLSPVHPKVNQYIYILIREIIDNYTVDGIHLDYIRFQNKNYGFNPVAMDQFKNETGVDPRYYMNTSNNHKKSISDEMFYELYDTYRVDAVNNLIKKI